MPVSELSASIGDRLGRRHVNHVLHGFPSVRMWDHDVPADLLADRVEGSSTVPLDLYVGIPFCIRTEPDRCGYCLFPTEEFERSSELDAYLSLLDREAATWADAFGHRPVRSLYIGGGTPNLLRSSQYGPLMELVRRRFPLLGDASTITLEGIPQLFSERRLTAIRDAGIGRISMGAQQLDDELTALSGRRQTARQVLDAVAACRSLGLACNVDLIYGWPRQTIDTMLHDLERLTASGVDHVTHYELNVGGPTDFALNRRDELPDVAEARRMYLEARRFLLGAGYRQLTSYDFERVSDAAAVAGGFVYEECRRDFELTETRGWGQAAITRLIDGNGGAWSLMNHRDLGAYRADIDRPGGPLGPAFHAEPIDLRLTMLFGAIQGLLVDGASYRSTFGVGLDEFDTEWTALEEQGLVERDGADIRVTELGGSAVPLIQDVVAESRRRQLTERRFSSTGPVDPGSGHGQPVALRARG